MPPFFIQPEAIPVIKLSGTLYIRAIHGRNGTFSVGRLVTEIGEFAVKDTLLDQYDEGRYEGEFGVSRIYPTNYLAGGRLVVEVRATLATMALAAIDELPAEQQSPLPEPDPIDLEPRAEATATSFRVPVEETCASGASGDETLDSPDSPPDQEADERLFGVLWPLGATVKLDTTVDVPGFGNRRTGQDHRLLPKKPASGRRVDAVVRRSRGCGYVLRPRTLEKSPLEPHGHLRCRNKLLSEGKSLARSG
nr:DUF3275 family protein [Methylocaldum sp. RMAD-M]